MWQVAKSQLTKIVLTPFSPPLSDEDKGTLIAANPLIVGQVCQGFCTRLFTALRQLGVRYGVPDLLYITSILL